MANELPSATGPLPQLWDRIVVEGVDGDVWNGGMVRLNGSDLIGGAPAVHITGITFHPGHVQRLADRQRPKHLGTSRPERPTAQPVAVVAPVAPASGRRAAPDPTVIPPRAILASIDQAMAALGLGRTTINSLMASGRLDRRKVGRSTRVTAAGIHALAGG